MIVVQVEIRRYTRVSIVRLQPIPKSATTVQNMVYVCKNLNLTTVANIYAPLTSVAWHLLALVSFITQNHITASSTKAQSQTVHWYVCYYIMSENWKCYPDIYVPVESTDPNRDWPSRCCNFIFRHVFYHDIIGLSEKGIQQGWNLLEVKTAIIHFTAFTLYMCLCACVDIFAWSYLVPRCSIRINVNS